MKRITGVVLFILCAALIFATGGTEKKKFVIGYCSEQLADPYLKKLSDAFNQAAAKYGLQVEVYDAQQVLEKQLSQIDTCISKKVGVIIVIPVDAQGLVPGVKAANAAGIPVICIANSVAGGDFTMVGSDQVVSGKMQGEYLAKSLAKDASVVYMRGIEGLQVTEDRHSGFMEAMKARPDVKVLADKTAKFARPEAMQLMEDWIQAFPHFDAVITANDAMALGAMDALKGANRLSGVQIAGVDALTEAVQAVKKGEMAMTVLQDALGQAGQAVELCKMLSEGKKIGKSYMVPFKVVTKENADEFLK